uniref:EGF-like domain-containing protein n=1 Tax=Tetradesmus obliquus TaxID=3088 RepID=A0A383VXZ1_TETOB|eukprot:jgi/Sobl393_1/15125/SZX70345.1
MLLIVLGSEPASCRLLIRGRTLLKAQDPAAAADSSYFQPDTTAASSSQAWDTPTPTASGTSAPWTGSSSSSSSSGGTTSSQPWTYSLRGSTAAANTYTGSSLAAGSYTGSTVAAGSYTGSSLAAGSYTGSTVAAGSYTGSSLAAGSYTRTYRQPCSYAGVCQHYGRCVAYGWTFTCDCPEGWGGWYCEKPVAARNTVLGAIPSVPSLAPQQPGYSSSTLAAATTTSLFPVPNYAAAGSTGPWTAAAAVPVTPSQLGAGFTAGGQGSSDSSGAYVYNAGVQRTTVGYGGAGFGPAAWPAAAAAAGGQLDSDTGSGTAGVTQQAPGTAGVTQQAPGTVTGGVTRPSDAEVLVTPSAAPQHDKGEDPRLDDGVGVTSDTGDTSDTSDTSSKGSAGAGPGAAAAVSKQGPSPVDVRPPIIGVVAPVG